MSSVKTGSFFQGLTAYDLLGNLIPGVVLLLAVVLFFPNPKVPLTGGGYAIFVLFSFILGGLVQQHASKATGPRKNFKLSIYGKKIKGDLEISEDSSDGDSEQGDQSSGTAGHSGLGRLLWSSFVHPISLGPDDEQGEQVKDHILASRISQYIHNKYEITPDPDSVDVVYRLMLSELGKGGSSPTAIRMQALRNFYRGTWIAMWYTSMLFILSIAINQAFVDCEYSPIEFQTPGYYHYSPEPLHVLPLLLISVILLRFMNGKKNRDFVEYLFTDYSATISFSDESEENASETQSRGPGS